MHKQSMQIYSKYRLENVPSVALLQNDCATGGLSFTVLGEHLYFLEGKTISRVNWTVDKSKKVTIYESEHVLRHLTSNQHFLAVIEENKGLALFDASSEKRYCNYPQVQEHYGLYDTVLYFNSGLDVNFINMESDVSGHLLTVDQPIKQIIMGEEMAVIQMQNVRFQEASKLLYHLNTEDIELVGEEVKFIDSTHCKKIMLEGNDYVQTEAMDTLNFGNAPRKVWRYLRDGLNEGVTYYESDVQFIYKIGDRKVYVDSLTNAIAMLQACNRIEWFAVIGSLIVYFDGTLKWRKTEDEGEGK